MIVKDDKILISSSSEVGFRLSNGVWVGNSSWLLNQGNLITPFEDDFLEFLQFHNNLDFLMSYIESYNPEILLVGCGKNYLIPPFNFRSYINKLGLKLDWMITPSALYTWNIMRLDYREIIGLFIF